MKYDSDYSSNPVSPCQKELLFIFTRRVNDVFPGNF